MVSVKMEIIPSGRENVHLLPTKRGPHLKELNAMGECIFFFSALIYIVMKYLLIVEDNKIMCSCLCCLILIKSKTFAFIVLSYFTF